MKASLATMIAALIVGVGCGIDRNKTSLIDVENAVDGLVHLMEWQYSSRGKVIKTFDELQRHSPVEDLPGNLPSDSKLSINYLSDGNASSYKVRFTVDVRGKVYALDRDIRKINPRITWDVITLWDPKSKAFVPVPGSLNHLHWAARRLMYTWDLRRPLPSTLPESIVVQARSEVPGFDAERTRITTNQGAGQLSFTLSDGSGTSVRYDFSRKDFEEGLQPTIQVFGTSGKQG